MDDYQQVGSLIATELLDPSRKELLIMNLKWFSRICIINSDEGIYDRDEIEEVQQIINLTKDMGLQGKELEKLVQGIELVRKFQEDVRVNTEAAIDVQKLKKLNKQAKKFGIYFKESNEIKRMYKRHREIGKILEKGCSMSVLQDISTEMSNTFNNSPYSESIKEMLQRAKDIEKEIQEFLNQEKFTENDINIKSNKILKKIELCKVELNEKKEILVLQESFQWLRKLYNFWNDQDFNRRNKMEEEFKSKKEAFLKEDPYLKDITVDKMIQVCGMDKTDMLQDIKNKNYSEYKNLIEEGRNISHKDKRVQQVYQNHLKTCWIIDALKVLESSNSFEDQEIFDLYQKANEIGINPLNSVYLQIEEEYKMLKYNKWKQKFDSFIASEAFESILKEAQDPNLNQLISELIDEYNNLKFDSEMEIKVLMTALAWLRWAAKANQTLKVLKEEGQKIPFEEFQILLSTAVVVKIPPDCPAYQEIESLFIQQKPLCDTYAEYLKQKQEFKELISSLGDNLSEQKERYDRIAARKPEINSIIELEKNLLASVLYVETSELEEIKKDIQECKMWCNRVDTLINSNVSQRSLDISNQIKQINTEKIKLILRDTRKERDLRRFEWSLSFRSIVKKEEDKASDDASKLNSHKEVNLVPKIDKMEVLQTDAKDDKQVTDLRTLTAQVNKFKEQEAMMKELKTREAAKERKNFQKEKAIVKLLEELGEYKVHFEKEIKHITSLLEKSKVPKQIYEEIQNTKEKVPKEKFITALEKFYKLPIRFPEEKKLESSLKKGKRLDKIIQAMVEESDSLKNNLEKAKTVYEEYKECCVLIPKAGKISKFYIENKKKIEELEVALEAGRSLSFEDLQKLTKQANEIGMKQEPMLEKIKRRIWIIKVNFIKSWKENKSSPDFPLFFSVVKLCLQEGYDYLIDRDAIKELRASLQFMENLVKEVEENVVRLAYEEGALELEKIDHKLFNFIDIREEIKDYKGQATPNFNPKDRSIVRGLSSKEDEAILQYKKKRNEEQKADKKAIRKDFDKKMKEIKSSTSTTTLIGKRKIVSNEENKENLEPGTRERGQKIDKKDKIVKKVEKEDGSLVIKETKKVYELQITEDVRQKVIRKFVEVLKANPHFGEVKDFDYGAKQIETGIFSQSLNRRGGYEKRERKILNFFNELRNFKMISKKILKANFNYAEIEKIIAKGESLEEVEKELTPKPMEEDLKTKIILASKELEKNEKAKQSLELTINKKASYDSILNSLLVSEEAQKEDAKSLFKKLASNNKEGLVKEINKKIMPGPPTKMSFLSSLSSAMETEPKSLPPSMREKSLPDKTANQNTEKETEKKLNINEVIEIREETEVNCKMIEEKDEIIQILVAENALENENSILDKDERTKVSAADKTNKKARFMKEK